jgi:Xaa-Pro aminopeptidase
LILSDGEAGSAASTGVMVRDYPGFTIEPLQGIQAQARILQEILQSASKPIRVGVELNFLPAALAPILHAAFPGAAFHPLDGAFETLRAVKSAVEIEKIKAALRLCDLAQQYVAANAAAGVSEIQLWGGMKAHLEIAAGARLPVLADLVAGMRTVDVGGLPGAYVLQPGDPVIADIVPRLDGYWGDNAGTHFVGKPGAELKKIYRTVRAVLRQGVAAVRPGLRACDLDRMLRAAIEEQGYTAYPHHSGHGMGATFHEEPRLVPYNPMSLEPGMVVAVEPGIYLPGVGGVRLEDVVLVTPDGCEVLTTHLLHDLDD